MAQVGEFVHVDQSDSPQYFIEFLDLVDRTQEMPAVRALTYSAMQIRPHSRVLDVGCGIGTAAIEMAHLVGKDGSVDGVDISDVMIAEARSRARNMDNLAFQVGDVLRLPYDDHTFDATRMERTLLYIKDRERALAEMIRVTVPGGRVVAADVDFHAVSTFSKNRSLTRKMTSLIADYCVHPTSGPELPYLLRTAGLKEVSASPAAIRVPYEFTSHVSKGALRLAIDQGKATQQEVETWFEELASIEAAGDFFQSWLFTIASGVTP